MGEAVGTVIWASLVASSAAIVFYELVRSVQPVVSLDKLVAAGIWVVMLVGACVVTGMEGPLYGLYLLVPVGLIWFGDELGSVTGLKYGLVQRQSPGILVRLFGWFLLIAYPGITVYWWIACDTH